MSGCNNTNYPAMKMRSAAMAASDVVDLEITELFSEKEELTNLSMKDLRGAINTIYTTTL
jgi:hypothetical protein